MSVHGVCQLFEMGCWVPNSSAMVPNLDREQLWLAAVIVLHQAGKTEKDIKNALKLIKALV